MQILAFGLSSHENMQLFEPFIGSLKYTRSPNIHQSTMKHTGFEYRDLNRELLRVYIVHIQQRSIYEQNFETPHSKVRGIS